MPEVIGPAGTKTAGKCPNCKNAYKQAWHNLVTYTQQSDGIEHIVRQRNGGRHGDDVAAEQRQLHTRFALGDAITHGRRATRKLRGGADFMDGVLDDGGIGFKRLVCRQHIVIRRHDGDVGMPHFAQHDFVFFSGAAAQPCA